MQKHVQRSAITEAPANLSHSRQCVGRTSIDWLVSALVHPPRVRKYEGVRTISLDDGKFKSCGRTVRSVWDANPFKKFDHKKT